jgi:PIN domain nuclease of toxin-antitoxin system
LNLLLDTNVLLRIGMAGVPLGPQVHKAIVQAECLYVTPISRTEIGIKMSVGKLTLPVPEEEFWRRLTHRLQAKELHYSCSHAALLANMALIHRDPFDRMIAAQCLVEGVHLATTDAIFEQYGVKVIN